MKILRIEWTTGVAGEYFVDKDQYSVAHEMPEWYEFQGYSQTLYFDKATGRVENSNCIEQPCKWNIIEEDI